MHPLKKACLTNEKTPLIMS